jgi:putative toxin-antitoxin system antitoxin component (TIGR02293 family)
MQMMDFSLDEMSTILHVSERTLRRYDDKSNLNIEQSERIIELNNLYQFGIEVLGSLDNFKIWINSPILALGQKKPKEFLDTSLGINMLKNILGRIQYGVFS